MSELFARLANFLGFAVPPYGMAAIVVILLYAIQSEVRFGKRARTHKSGSADRGSTRFVSVASLVPIAGFALIMKAEAGSKFFVMPFSLPVWIRWPGGSWDVTALGWAGVTLAALGVLTRLWAVMTLRDRYTRTLLVQQQHKVERSGPYRFVRHPGYVGSLLCLNGTALASGSALLVVASASATFAAYSYRVRREDEMLIAAFGDEYDRYRREVGGLLPFVR